MKLGGRPGPDKTTKLAAVSLAAGRLAIGIGVSFATKPALRGLGFDADDPSTRALGRLAGSRDIAMGALALAALDDAVWLKRMSIAGAFIDAGDALSFGTALVRREGIDQAGVMGAPSALAASAFGLWIASRL